MGGGGELEYYNHPVYSNVVKVKNLWCFFKEDGNILQQEEMRNMITDNTEIKQFALLEHQ